MLNFTIPFSTTTFWSDIEFAVYVVLQSQCKETIFDKTYVTIESVTAQIFKDKDPKHVEIVTEALKKFKTRGIIKRELNMYSVNTDVFILDTRFVSITSDAVKKIMDEKKFHLLKHLVILKSTFDYNIEVDNKKGIIGHMPISYISDISGVSEQTVSKNNSDLEKMGIICIYRNKFVNGTRRPNLYCLKENEPQLIKFSDLTKLSL